MKLQNLKMLVLILWVVFGIFAWVAPGYAQQNISFESLQIDLWPEYDRPEMLVVYRFQLAADVQLPVALNIQIPAAAGEPNAVAKAQSGGPLMNLEYTSNVQGEWNMLQLTADQPVIQIEYYDPSLQIDGTDRSYVYKWAGGYDIAQVIFLVQQPIGAQGMEILPRLNDVTQGSDGIVYYSGEIGSFEADETFERSIKYQKDSESLTIEFLEINSPPVNEDTTGRVSLVNIVPWGIGLLGVIVIVAGVYWYMATGKRTVKVSKDKLKPPQVKETKPEVKTKSQLDIYCHQCGKRAEDGDKFCRSCGTKLRI